MLRFPFLLIDVLPEMHIPMREHVSKIPLCSRTGKALSRQCVKVTPVLTCSGRGAGGACTPASSVKGRVYVPVLQLVVSSHDMTVSPAVSIPTCRLLMGTSLGMDAAGYYSTISHLALMYVFSHTAAVCRMQKRHHAFLSGVRPALLSHH